MTLIWLHGDRLSEERTEESGYIWTIHDPQCPSDQLEVFHSGPESIGVRLETEDNVDLMILSHGQCYDLLKALSRALAVNS